MHANGENGTEMALTGSIRVSREEESERSEEEESREGAVVEGGARGDQTPTPHLVHLTRQHIRWCTKIIFCKVFFTLMPELTAAKQRWALPGTSSMCSMVTGPLATPCRPSYVPATQRSSSHTSISVHAIFYFNDVWWSYLFTALTKCPDLGEGEEIERERYGNKMILTVMDSWLPVMISPAELSL